MNSLWRQLGVSLAVAFLVLGSAPLSADDAPWDAIASDATFVARLDDPQTSFREVIAFCELVKEGSGDRVQAYFSSLGKSIKNPTLAGVNRGSSWWVAAYDNETADVFILPATDIKAMNPPAKDFRFMEFGKYAVYATRGVAAEKTAARLKGEGLSIGSVIDGESRRLFDRGGISIFANMQATHEEPGRERDFYDAFRQARDDAQSVTLTMDVSDTGISLEGLVRLRAGTPTLQRLPKSAPAPMAEIMALPAGQVFYASAVGDWLDWWSSRKVRQDENDRLVKPHRALKSAEARLRELKFDAVAYSTALTDFDGVISEARIIRTKNVQAVRELTRQAAVLKDGAETPTYQWQVEAKLASERYGDHFADVTTWRRVFRKPADAGPDPKFWAVATLYLPDCIVETTGGDRDTMRAVFAALTDNKPQEGNSQLQATRSRLDGEADAIVLVDAPTACVRIGAPFARDSGAQLLRQLSFGLLAAGPGTIGTDEVIERLNMTESFCGMSVVGLPDGVQIRAFVPLAQIQGFVQIFEALNGD